VEVRWRLMFFLVSVIFYAFHKGTEYKVWCKSNYMLTRIISCFLFVFVHVYVQGIPLRSAPLVLVFFFLLLLLSLSLYTNTALFSYCRPSTMTLRRTGQKAGSRLITPRWTSTKHMWLQSRYNTTALVRLLFSLHVRKRERERERKKVKICWLSF
jgi:hypothetical protein